MHTFFAYLARMKYIQRWGLMRNSFPENDAEHTLQTVMIAHGLAVIREKIFHEPCDAEHCAMLAVYHDAGEVFTGDMPTPVKYFTEDLHDKYKEIEDKARRTPFGNASRRIERHLPPLYFGHGKRSFMAAGEIGGHVVGIPEMRRRNTGGEQRI